MKTKLIRTLAALFALAIVTTTRAQSTAFTYQGVLSQGSAAANGPSDLTFTLYTAASGGATVGVSNVVNDLAFANGLFTVTLDFGGSAFDGSVRWLEIAVRPGESTGNYTNLAPRQPITATPYAVRALEAAAVPSGAITSAMLANGAVTSAKIAPGAVNQLGSPDGSPLAALQVNTNGFVGLGTDAPLSALHIAASQGVLNYELASVRVDESAGYTNLAGSAGVAVQGNLLAVAAFNDAGVTLMDISDPAAPVLRAQIRDGDGVFTNLSGAWRLAMRPNLLAVAAYNESAVTLINVADPANPVKLAELRDGVGGFNELDFVDAVAISGNLLAVAGSAVTLVDITNPALPVNRAELKQGVGGFNLLSSIESIALAGNLLAIGSGFPDRAVTLVDVSNPASPVKRAEIVNGAAGYDSLGGVNGLALSGGLLAIASQTANAVTLVNVANPASPVRLAVLSQGVNATDLVGAFGVALSGQQLAVGGRASVSVFDLATPASPVELGVVRNAQGEFHYLTDPRAVAFAGSNVIAASLSTHAVNIIAPRSRPSSLTTAGWVGLGTTKPAAPLHVIGDVRVDQASRVELNTTHFEAGTDTAALGFGSTAMGYQSMAAGDYSTALGYQAGAGGNYAMALGYRAYAQGFAAAALGSGRALGDFSVALGSAQAIGAHSLAAGDSSWAEGSASTALGYRNYAGGFASFAGGARAQAMHDYSFVWSDGAAPFSTTTNNQFLVRASGGVRLETGGGGMTLDGVNVLSGIVPSASLAGTYSSAVTLNNAANSFTGNGANLTALNASQLTSGTVPAAALSNAWRLGGNAGTTPGTHFLGTTDNLPVELKVNGARALRLEPTTYADTVNMIGGSARNFVRTGVVGATIGGGGGSGAFITSSTNSVEADFGTVSGGARNAIQFAAEWATIGGGIQNTIQPGADQSTIGGGYLNVVQTSAASAAIGGGTRNEIQFAADNGAIGGGDRNVIQTNAHYSTIGGGTDNRILNGATRATIGGGDQNRVGGIYATVPGGVGNQAMGQFSFAAGHDAKALHQGAFVWADSPVGGFSSTANDQFLIKAAGGVGINLNTPNGAALAVNGNVTINGTLGTTGNQPLQFNVNGQRVLYLESNPNGSPNVLSGSPSNRITAGLEGATIAGGGIGLFPNTITASYGTIGGGTLNAASGGWATIGGGRDNSVAGDYSTLSGGRLNRIQTNATYGSIGGGYQNTIRTNADYATIGGGFLNTILTNADRATIGGGDQNTAGGIYATVPGGVGNQALGQFSLAAGHNARALHDGAFVWGDAPGGGFSSTANNQFCIQARGGIQIDPLTSQYFGTASRQMLNLFGTSYGIGVQSSSLYFRCDSAAGTDGFIWYRGGVHNDDYAEPGAGGTELMHLVASGLYVNGALVPSSDRNLKENFKPIDARAVLDKVAALPLSEWNYKQDPATRHVGPMAQDFYAAFGVGPDDKHIATVDADGVALAAIQGLNEKVEGRGHRSEVRIQKLEAENAELKQRLEALEKIIHHQKAN